MQGRPTIVTYDLHQGLKPALEGLLIYQGIWQDPVLNAFRSLVGELDLSDQLLRSKGESQENQSNIRDTRAGCGEPRLSEVYYAFLGLLMESNAGIRLDSGVEGSVWQEHLLDIMLAYSSPVLEALCKEGLGYGKASAFSWHMDVLKHDLMLLSRLFWAFDAGVSRWIAEALVDTSLPQDGILHALHRWQAGEEPMTSGASHRGENTLRHGAQGTEASSAKAVLENGALALKGQFYSTCDWAELAPLLIDYHGKYGIGHFAKHAAFTWSSAPGGGLVGVDVIDPIQLDELSGYGEQVEKVVVNTERFLQGLPAHNVLLYGDRGTGKSSTVKGLIHKFVDQGLRLVEVGREELGGLGDLVQNLSRSSLKFIVFVDDLSFEENETEFKALKSVLEGSIIRQPDNVRIYATSNRRHLIKESFSDVDAGGELRWQDTVQEKLSLSDRFGLTVIYPSPDQKTYLSIVEHLAAMEGLSMDQGELRARALQWTLWHNERSGRTARQFIDELKAEQEMQG
ncbi:MAG: ATP-binding protein [Firmicutes bacterium]|nr:ATP-binding protein [Bacillota bacterium]